VVKLFIEPLQKTRHNRNSFDCGLPAVNDFLRKAARRQMALRINYTWVAVGDAQTPAPVLAYFTLTQCAVYRAELPDQSGLSRWPRYPLPVLKLAWLGVDKAHQGSAHRLGELMLVESINRAHAMALDSGLGVALVADPLTDHSERFFLRYGFQKMRRPFRDRATLFLPLAP